MKWFKGIFKMTFISELQYRAAAWSGILTNIFIGAIFIMIYSAFYKSGTEVPMNFKDLASYIWLGQGFFLLTSLSFQDWELIDTVRYGSVSYEMVRPYELYGFWFGRLMAQRMAAVALRFLPVLAVAFLIPAPYGLSLPATWTGLILSIISLLLSFILATAISMYVYIFLFRVLAAWGATTILAVISSFFSGGIIPIPLMPDYMYQIVNALPFRYLGDFPFRVYTGGIGTNDAVFGILIQIIWIIGLILLGRVLFRIASRKVEIQGG